MSEQVDLRENAAAGSPAARRSAGVRAALFALSVYKAYFSVLIAGTCRYEPTCSRYAGSGEMGNHANECEWKQ